ncbi:amino acid permease [Serinibacter arcticus]|uniref:Amino acid permease n=1 Tax=Serinibacter arcticus TaxID=1655435 RepID=A0A2U1ZZK7_9MICO|nr:amino acid permease [Serinibacter arcticus]
MAPARVLRRTLGTVDAVAIGLAAMLGAGVFSVFGPAAAAAGDALVPALAIAAVVAALNAAATAQLAAASPVAGGAYAYGRERLGPWPGFVAGWGFVIGKTASCAAIAWTLGAHALPGHERWVAAVAVVVLALVNLGGVTRTARTARVLAVLVVTALLAVVVVGLGLPPADVPSDDVPPAGWTAGGVLQAAGLLFFAFAGYARVATLGEEVRDPRRTIPRAVALSLGVVLVIYAALALVLQRSLGAGLATTTAPLTDLAEEAIGAPGTAAIRAVAVLACAASLLALQAGVGRTALAMAREGDLPRPLAHLSSRGVPARGEVAVAVVVTAAVLVVDLRGLVAFSSFGVLVYYGVANLAAFTQPREERRLPRAFAVLGALACLALVTTLPGEAVLVGLGVLALGVVGRLLTVGTVGRVRRLPR